MTRLALSIIIPTFNKRAVLAETLAALEVQTLPADQFEVIVVDDGSTDGTREWLHAQAEERAGERGREGERERVSRPYPLTVLAQANQGAAAARNAGAAAAAGDILLFLDADIIAAPGLAASHLNFQETHEASLMIGRILPPMGAPAAYCIFSQSFDFGPEPRTVGPGIGVTGQMSVRVADFERIGGFRAGWPRAEDVDFSRRSVAHGLQIAYRSDAVGRHNHVLALNQLVRKEFDNHAGLVPFLVSQPGALEDFPYLAELWPLRWGVDPLRLALRKLARAVVAAPPTRGALYALCAAAERFWPVPAVMDFLVWKLLGAYQWLGLRKGMAEYGWRPHAES